MSLIYNSLQKDTIAAIATAASDAGIGIIRISGPEAVGAADKLFRSKKGERTLSGFRPGTIHFGYVIDPDTNETVDEVMVSVMRAPHSYTTEDTVEINTHGGVYLMQKILSLVFAEGVRPAQPGEFTKRAFLGGRIDLTQAEAVMDIISAQNSFSAKTAARQIRGSVLTCVRSLRERILYEIAFIESALDDPENYSLDGYPEKLRGICLELKEKLAGMILFSQEGRILKEGIRTVIAGKPNTGKSSLLNSLSGYERAIVTDIAGTTRDTLEETVRIGEVLLQIVDTAGIRSTEDEIEKIGVERALREIESAQLILFLLDSSCGITDEDRETAEAVRRQTEAGAKCILLLNKTDRPRAITDEEAESFYLGIAGSAGRREEGRILQVSVKTGDGMESLRSTIREMFRIGEIENNSEILLSNMRQIQDAKDAMESLNMVISSIDSGMSEDFFSVDLQNAYASLGEIIGETVEDDVATEIFSKFCLGK